MPIPFILGIAAAAAAAVGVGAQYDAKKTNEKAQALAEEAVALYNKSKESLEKAKEQTEQSLLTLGTSKKEVLETSINQFLVAFGRIKNIELRESTGINEIEKFALNKYGILQLREMSSIYQSAFSSGTAGAATGAIMSLAASGAMPIVAGTLSTAGTALVAGKIGLATSITGSALSLTAAVTPLAMIAAPVMLFSGISASMKADENLEKARAMYAEAKAASEEMKTSKMLCKAISDKAYMFNNLLIELNGMFSYCTSLLDGVTKQKTGFFSKTIDANNLSEKEMQLVAVTRSLAGAVKAVIDTPILTDNGKVSVESTSVYNDLQNKLPAFNEAVNEVKAISYDAKPITAKPKGSNNSNSSNSIFDVARNIFAVLAGILMVPYALDYTGDWLVTELWTVSIVPLMIMKNEGRGFVFKCIKNICCFILATAFCVLFYDTSQFIQYWGDSVFELIGIGVVSFIATLICLPKDSTKASSLMCNLTRVFGCVFFYILAVAVYAFLNVFLGISHSISSIITLILYAPFTLIMVYMI